MHALPLQRIVHICMTWHITYVHAHAARSGSRPHAPLRRPCCHSNPHGGWWLFEAWRERKASRSFIRCGFFGGPLIHRLDVFSRGKEIWNRIKSESIKLFLRSLLVTDWMCCRGGKVDEKKSLIFTSQVCFLWRKISLRVHSGATCRSNNSQA